MQARVADAKKPYEPIDQNNQTRASNNFKTMPLQALSHIASIGMMMVGVVTSFPP